MIINNVWILIKFQLLNIDIATNFEVLNCLKELILFCSVNHWKEVSFV